MKWEGSGSGSGGSEFNLSATGPDYEVLPRFDVQWLEHNYFVHAKSFFASRYFNVWYS